MAIAPPFGSSLTTRKLLLLWAVWFGVLVTASYISYQFQHLTDSLLLYLPTALSVVLVHWYGYRMLPVIYVNGIVTLLIWNIPGGWSRVLLIGTHEPVIAFVSKFLTDRFLPESGSQMRNTKHFARFTLFGIIVPFFFNSLYTYNYSYINGDLQKVALLWLSDFITVFSLSIPLLYFFTGGIRPLLIKQRPLPFTRTRQVIEFAGLVISFLAISFFVPFEQYWFIYGIMAVVVAVRQGFESVLLINAIIFSINYVLPLIESSTALITTSGSTQLISVHLGNATILFISTLVGRALTDLRETEKNLIDQKQEVERTNQQLKQSNQELDRFVYSVSHDLSAPLKSIQGLIQLSKMDNNPAAQKAYLDMIEKSANRLNDFIGEVLDYSKTSRKEIIVQKVNLAELIKGLEERFILDNYEKKTRLIASLDIVHIETDPVLIKIALGNLVSNALKFQRRSSEQHEVVINSTKTNNTVTISIKDNGEGIQAAHLSRIFDMFYRATSNSPGSGLGLYIAREAVAKLGGEISVNSVYGEGSTFTVAFPC